MPYEIQHYTLLYGWINTWTYAEADGVMQPETFATAAEATAALDEFFEDLDEEVAAGLMASRNRDEFRIRQVGSTASFSNRLPTVSWGYSKESGRETAMYTGCMRSHQSARNRRTSETDRRVQVIRLTKAGRAEFRKMAAEHENWIADIFSDLAPKDVRELMRLLAKTKASAKAAKERAL